MSDNIRGQVIFNLYDAGKHVRADFTGEVKASDISTIIYELRMGYASYIKRRGQVEQQNAAKSA